MILAIGLLIVGRRLPAVGRSLGKGIKRPKEVPRTGEDDRRVSRSETQQNVSETQA